MKNFNNKCFAALEINGNQRCIATINQDCANCSFCKEVDDPIKARMQIEKDIKIYGGRSSKK